MEAVHRSKIGAGCLIAPFPSLPLTLIIVDAKLVATRSVLTCWRVGALVTAIGSGGVGMLIGVSADVDR